MIFAKPRPRRLRPRQRWSGPGAACPLRCIAPKPLNSRDSHRLPVTTFVMEPAMFFDAIKAAVLGVVEGLTEYIPVSSTGHLLLMQHFFGFSDEAFGNTFAVLIQLGAILALLSIYFTRLVSIATASLYDPKARRFVLGVLV